MINVEKTNKNEITHMPNTERYASHQIVQF